MFPPWSTSIGTSDGATGSSADGEAGDGTPGPVNDDTGKAMVYPPGSAEELAVVPGLALGDIMSTNFCISAIAFFVAEF